MTQKKKIVHPNFFIGLLSHVVLFAASMFFITDKTIGIPLALAALSLALVHWIWSMVDAWNDPELKNKEVGNTFWFSLILLIPPLAGLFYYMINAKRI